MEFNCRAQGRVFLLSGVAVLLMLVTPRAAHAGWAEDALKSEADYIVNCSFTTYAKNNGQVQRTDAAYGALNNVRLQDGPDWVKPGEGAMAMIGLMAATKRLKAQNYPVDVYVGVVDAFFNDWLLKNRTALCQNPESADDGGFASQVAYNTDGSLKEKSESANSGVSGAMLCAMWKYYEFNVAMGRTARANEWLGGDAFALARGAGRFIERCHNATYNLVSPSPSGGNLWVGDASLSVAGLRCLAKWAQTAHQTVALDDEGTSPTQLGDALVSGIEKMKDEGESKGFFKTLNPADGSRSYEGSLDQLCFVPYETNALEPSQEFARSISDFWTQGAGGRRMTYQSDNEKAWTYFGTRWHWYDDKRAENDRLTPGPGLQLAKVEWKYAHEHGDAEVRKRAMARFQFANSKEFSNLWYGADKRGEAGVAGGIVDWRVASAPNNAGNSEGERAPEWQRFVDTSAYFIEVTLMAFWDEDTKYTPD